MKKVSKSNPLKTFNDNKDMAYKKAGGAMSDYKKYLKKAQYGRVYEGPINEKDTKKLDKWYPSTAPVVIPNAPKEADLIRGLNPFVNGQMVSDQEREFMERQRDENKLRRGFRNGGTKMAKGGATKFGMLSVKAGIDKNPKPTAADRIAGAKKKKKKK